MAPRCGVIFSVVATGEVVLKSFRLHLLVFCAAALAAPAQAQMLSLQCGWPGQSKDDMFFDIDLAGGRITWYPTSNPAAVYGPATAQITPQKITWSWRFGGPGETNFIIDRMRGTWAACDSYTGQYVCSAPRTCKPIDTTTPKF